MGTKQKTEYGILKKQIKKCSYFLGLDEDGTGYYLNFPSWDCSWYWGFGYIQGYRLNQVGDKFHESHQHADKFLSEWFTEWNGSDPILKQTTFTEAEGWKLTELLRQFYVLRESADLFYRGNTHCSPNGLESLKDLKLAENINKVLMPKVFKQIETLLTPTE